MSTPAADVLKPDFAASRRHFIFTEEHDRLRESIHAFVRQGAQAARGGVGADDVPGLGVPAHGRAGAARALLSRGVRRPGRRLLLQPGPGRGARALGLRRPGHGPRGPHGHGDPADPPVRHGGAEAALPRARDRGREDLLPRHHRARRRLRRLRHPHPRGARRRRVGDQRVEDLHHQRAPGRLHRARGQDRPGGRPRRHQPLPGRHGPAGRDPREEAREARHARLRHGAARLPGRPRARGRAARPGGQGLLPHHVGAPGRAADRRGGLRRGRPEGVRQDARLRHRAPGLRPARSGASR